MAGCYSSGPSLRPPRRGAPLPLGPLHRPWHHWHEASQPAAIPCPVPLPQEHQTVPLHSNWELRDEWDRFVPAFNVVWLLRLCPGSFTSIICFLNIISLTISLSGAAYLVKAKLDPPRRRQMRCGVSWKPRSAKSGWGADLPSPGGPGNWGSVRGLLLQTSGRRQLW